ncbi:hypothetical protein [Fusobacterium ulcerans]|uniref:hypothetical protein n=1 Tax=Fusobacterium ulcerans TaxID=861 RepID=UPI0027B8A3BF|nr:hypothetical protein [Fusobacterium ulcerans]
MTKEELKNKINNIVENMEFENYFISFVSYIKGKKEFGNCILQSQSIAVFKQHHEKKLAEKLKVDTIIITNYIKLTEEEAKIYNLMK